MWINIDSYNKATLSVEGDIAWVLSQGWPNQTALSWRSGIDDGTTQFWREINYMVMETLMSGT